MELASNLLPQMKLAARVEVETIVPVHGGMDAPLLAGTGLVEMDEAEEFNYGEFSECNLV